MTVRICNPGTGIYASPGGGVAAPGEFLDVEREDVAQDIAAGRVIVVEDQQDAAAVEQADEAVDEAPTTPSRRGRSPRSPQQPTEGA